jgi:hypothetical protein
MYSTVHTHRGKKNITKERKRKCAWQQALLNELVVACKTEIAQKGSFNEKCSWSKLDMTHF